MIITITAQKVYTTSHLHNTINLNFSWHDLQKVLSTSQFFSNYYAHLHQKCSGTNDAAICPSVSPSVACFSHIDSI